MGAPARVFASRRLPGAAFERLARAVDLVVWHRPEAPTPDALAQGCVDAEGLLCLLDDRIDA
jgi:glyoxylate reductase